MTVRQVFYQLEVAGIVRKTEGGYRQVQTQVLAMRRQGMLDWGFITDGTRWRRKPQTWDSSQDYIQSVVRSYRRDLWRTQSVRIEVWLEKEALADVVLDVTNAWDVALMPSKGQSSTTFLHSAAKAAEEHYQHAGVTTHIYTLYDFDAGGERCARTIARELPELAGVPVQVHRLALTAEQITDWHLPTRPAKQSDPEAKKHGPFSVELDAIPPEKLSAMVEDAIVQHVDPHSWDLEQIIEREERAGLLRLAEVA